MNDYKQDVLIQYTSLRNSFYTQDVNVDGLYAPFKLEIYKDDSNQDAICTITAFLFIKLAYHSDDAIMQYINNTGGKIFFKNKQSLHTIWYDDYTVNTIYDNKISLRDDNGTDFIGFINLTPPNKDYIFTCLTKKDDELDDDPMFIAVENKFIYRSHI